ncbi:hypothetical protein HY480_02670 [Candidatus Uhrbacteria bacterium]|nr:hypothetical protein [Candidatus Uhrbacteria bacterium]
MIGPLAVLYLSEDIVRDFIWWQIAAIVVCVFAACASMVLLPINQDLLAMTSIVLFFSACASVVCFSSATQNVVALTAATAIGLSEFIAHADPQRMAVLGLFSAVAFLTGAMLKRLTITERLSGPWVAIGVCTEVVAVGAGIPIAIEHDTRVSGVAIIGVCALVLVAMFRLSILYPHWFQRPKPAPEALRPTRSP